MLFLIFKFYCQELIPIHWDQFLIEKTTIEVY